MSGSKNFSEWKSARYAKQKERKGKFTSLSFREQPALCTEETLRSFDPKRELGYPGEFPYTRGVQPTMYRGRLWTMRQFSGFGTPEDTNRRFKYLLEHGQTGLSTAFDMPSLMGYDPDHVRSKGEVGKVGVSISTLDEMRTLFKGIPLADVSTSMTINSPAAAIFATPKSRRRAVPSPPTRIFCGDTSR